MPRPRPLGYLEYAVLLLAAEKLLQHLFLSWALAAGAFGVRESVHADYRVIAVAGVLVAALFGLGIAGLWNGHGWGPNLLIALAAFDVVGEFITQATLLIEVTVSLVLALALIALAWRVRGLLASAVPPVHTKG